MTNRVLDLSESPAYLKVNLGRLVIERQDQESISVPLQDIAVLITAHRQITLTQAVFTGLMEAGACLVACDGKSMPVGAMLPICGHHLQTERCAQQASAKVPTCKRLWQQIVKAKIKAQGQVLYDLHGDDLGIREMRARVKSGDPENVEAQAARRYWPALFRDKNFRRDSDGGDANALLNYGYGVLRAQVARAICGAGLHPSLGIHHKNKYNAFCLVDDLMEPFRPIVDRAVVQHVTIQGKSEVLDKESKTILIGALMKRFVLENESCTLFDVLTRTAVSLVDVFAGKRRTLLLPEI